MINSQQKLLKNDGHRHSWWNYVHEAIERKWLQTERIELHIMTE